MDRQQMPYRGALRQPKWRRKSVNDGSYAGVMTDTVKSEALAYDGVSSPSRWQKPRVRRL
jgi:hypothetical protein